MTADRRVVPTPNEFRKKQPIKSRFSPIFSAILFLFFLVNAPAHLRAQDVNAYVTYGDSVSVINTGTNTVTATVGVGASPIGVAITPDGTRAYVANNGSVSVIDTKPSDAAYNTIVATVDVDNVRSLAITPDGTRVYVTPVAGSAVPVIDTNPLDGAAYNTVVATIDVPSSTGQDYAAITPDGNHAYVAPGKGRYVSVIDTNPSAWAAYNTVVATVLTGNGSGGVAITPALAFSSFPGKLDILSGPPGFQFNGTFALGTKSAINFLPNFLTLRVGTYSLTIPAASFTELKRGKKAGSFVYSGTLNGVALQVLLSPLGGEQYQIRVDASGGDLTNLLNPVTVALTIGDNTGSTAVTADFQ